MKKEYFLILVFLLCFSLACSKKEVNTSKVDMMLKVTDSLLEEISAFQIELIDSVYHISGKKLIDIGPNGQLSAKDSLEFYLLLQDISRKLRDIYQYSHKEILFSHYQLESIKEDILKAGEINAQLNEELNTEADVMKLLEQRVDSSILLMNESINQIYKFLGDTLSLTLITDSV
jgi:hypothetical protein